MSLEQAGPFEERPVETPSMTKQAKTQVVRQAIDLGTPKLNTMVKDSCHVTVNFYAMPMYLTCYSAGYNR